MYIVIVYHIPALISNFNACLAIISRLGESKTENCISDQYLPALTGLFDIGHPIHVSFLPFRVACSHNSVYFVVRFSLPDERTWVARQAWWRHQMETFSALLAICAGNSPVSGEFPAQRPVTRSFDVFFDLCPNKQLSKQSWGWWFETPSGSLWRHSKGKFNGGRRHATPHGATQSYLVRLHGLHTRHYWCTLCYWTIIFTVFKWSLSVSFDLPTPMLGWR